MLVLSDIHVGGTTSPWPISCVLDDGGRYQVSKAQQWLNKCWNHFHRTWLPSIIGKEPVTLVINGDTIEGVHHRTTQIVTLNFEDQVKAATMLLKPVVERSKAYYQIKGTGAHSGSSGMSEESIAVNLGAVQERASSRYSRFDLRLVLNGLLMHFTHHISPASPNTEASALQRELMYEAIEYSRSGWKRSHLQVRSHRHRFAYFRTAGNRAVVTTPAWQLHTEYVYKVKPLVVPEIGGLLISILPSGEYLVREKVYSPTCDWVQGSKGNSRRKSS